jgi:hypothetical protein
MAGAREEKVCCVVKGGMKVVGDNLHGDVMVAYAGGWKSCVATLLFITLVMMNGGRGRNCGAVERYRISGNRNERYCRRQFRA